ncbi:hypothetical protein CYMTET_36641 [Cymbomonas tetramitiformis]|uniref:ILEI/PANDER domain-containing protein n=1 Tax=Cymbomonas tetramitiformis TaxID=36881 RepID=A0AAE0CHY2_9CHLO|nr:hypothetical protein CYMTET_36641 [Cymbomonas tetramitiformis]
MQHTQYKLTNTEHVQGWWAHPPRGACSFRAESSGQEGGNTVSFYVRGRKLPLAAFVADIPTGSVVLVAVADTATDSKKNVSIAVDALKLVGGTDGDLSKVSFRTPYALIGLKGQSERCATTLAESTRGRSEKAVATWKSDLTCVKPKCPISYLQPENSGDCIWSSLSTEPYIWQDLSLGFDGLPGYTGWKRPASLLAGLFTLAYPSLSGPREGIYEVLAGQQKSFKLLCTGSPFQLEVRTSSLPSVETVVVAKPCKMLDTNPATVYQDGRWRVLKKSLQTAPWASRPSNDSLCLWDPTDNSTSCNPYPYFSELELTWQPHHCSVIRWACLSPCALHTCAPALRVVFLGDSNFEYQHKLFSFRAPLQWDVKWVSLKDGLAVVYAKAYEELREALMGATDAAIIFNIGLHEVDKYCGNTWKSWRYNHNISQDIDCIANYRVQLARLVHMAHKLNPRGLNAFMTTYAAWSKWGNWGFLFGGAL